MKWTLVFQKGLLGMLTFIASYLAINPSMVTKFIPSAYVNMTIGSFVAGLLVSAANWLKNRNTEVKK